MPAVHRPRATADQLSDAFGPGTPFPVADALALGIAPGRLRAALEAGSLQRVRRGVLVAPAAGLGVGRPDVGTAALTGVARRRDDAALREDHLVRAAAVLHLLGDGSVVSHGSAALLHELPTYGRAPHDVWVTAPRHGRVVAGTHRRLGAVEGCDVLTVAGIPVTSVARTALDLARRRPLHESLVALDVAVARCGRSALHDARSRLGWRRDLRALDRAIAEADGRSESPLESISRGRFLEAGLPRPELQAWVQVDTGARYRLDFLWKRHGVAGEADGWTKYASFEDLRAEKQREDALRRSGLVVIRWTSDELARTPDLVLTRLSRALNR